MKEIVFGGKYAFDVETFNILFTVEGQSVDDIKQMVMNAISTNDPNYDDIEAEVETYFFNWKYDKDVGVGNLVDVLNTIKVENTRHNGVFEKPAYLRDIYKED